MRDTWGIPSADLLSLCRHHHRQDKVQLFAIELGEQAPSAEVSGVHDSIGLAQG
jgi:hypothetical protein